MKNGPRSGTLPEAAGNFHEKGLVQGNGPRGGVRYPLFRPHMRAPRSCGNSHEKRLIQEDEPFERIRHRLFASRFPEFRS